MRLAVLFSGGKDSTVALHMAKNTDDVRCLVTLNSKNEESYMFHTQNINITEIQAKACGIPLISWRTEGIKEDEILDMKDALKKAKELYSIGGVVTGAIESVYQSERVQRVCDELGLWCLNPLWKTNPIRLMQEIVMQGYEVVISGVYAYPLDESWLGKVMDMGAVEELERLSQKHGISPCGEGGEIETTVLDAPMFQKRIRIKDSKSEYKNNAGRLCILSAALEKK